MEVEATSNLNINGRPIPVRNFTDMPDAVLYGDESMREVAQVMSRWVDNVRAAAGRTSMFDRGAYIPPDNAYDEMRSARHAVRYDSVVSGIAELTEAFAFQGVKWESENPDEADVFNQMARDQNLDDVIRKMWREEFIYGQFICAKMWGWKTYTVRGKTTKGNTRKKKYKVWAPLRLRILDSLKVVPVGVGPLGGDGLAWQATGYEIGNWQQCWNGDTIDPLMLTFFQEQYKPSFLEAGELSALGVDVSRLLSLNPDWVFRHTMTKPDYQRFADIRMKSLFTLLDMKQQLLMSDRAQLVGSANYILLIRKGDDKLPAQRAELESLQENYNFIAKMPVIISDHRLSVDIISPKTDFVLEKDKYDTIDQRIKERLLGLLSSGGGGHSSGSQSSGGGVAAQALPIARLMENRRHMLARTLENEIAHAVFEHPKNRDLFDKEPSMVYTPRNIGLTLDGTYAQQLLALRTQREVSRETILEFFGLDEATEAMRMQYEAEYYDDIFKTEIPYTKGSPNEDIDSNLDKKDQPSSLSLTVGPDGTLKATPPTGASPSNAKPGAKATDPKSMPASGQPKGKVTTPNGTGESPKVSGARGGRPTGGGKTANNPAKTARPRGAGGSMTKASDENAE